MATEERTKTFNVVWRLINYNRMRARSSKSDYFATFFFDIEDLNKSRWELHIYPRGYLDSKNVTCGLKNINMSAEKININYTIDVIGENNQTLSSHLYFNRMYKKEEDILEPLIKTDELHANMNDWKEDTLTLRCIIRNSKTMTQYEINPRIDFEQCNFAWDVRSPTSSSWSASKIVYLFGISAFEVTLTAPNNVILISIKRKQDTLQKLHFAIALMKNSKSIMAISKRDLFQLDTNHNVWQSPTLITKKMLETEKDGMFSLYCRFSARNGVNSKENTIHADKNPKETLPDVDALVSLRNDLRCIFKNKIHTDVNLRVGNETIPAHKLILSGRSSVFATMFQQNMIESKTNEVNITDLDIETVNSFLEFVYTGTVDNMCYESAANLLLAADKYQISSLGKKCSNFLMSVLSKENACDILTMADMFRQELLKEAAVDCIKNNASDILSSSGWSQWLAKNCKLGSEIVCQLSFDLSKKIKKT